MSYQLSRLDLVVNNATTQITVNTNPSTQSYINGDITPQDNVINTSTTVNRFSAPDDYPAATILSTSKALSLTDLIATEVGTVNIPISATVEGNGLKNLITNYYDGITYSPQLLTCVGVNSTSTTIEDLSSNNFTITNNGAATVSSFAPFLNSYQYASVLFNGTSQYLTLPANSAYDFGTGDFTIEFWAYFNALTTDRLLVDRWATGNVNSWQIYWRASSQSIAFIIEGTQVLVDPSTTNIAINKWAHIAAARSGSTIKLFINGILVATASNSTSLTNSLTLAVGAQFYTIGSTPLYFNGYISNLRIVKGAAVYLGNFLPPTINFSSASVTTITTKVNATTSTSTKLTYLPLNINLYNSLKYTAPTGQTEVYDSALTVNSYTTAATPNINVISSQATMNVDDRPDFYITGSDAPIVLSTEGRGNNTAAGSLSFNGTSQYLTIPDNTALQMGAGDFTVEFWINFSSITGYQTPFDKGYGGANSLVFQTGNSTGRLIIYSAGVALITETGTGATGAWIHYALVRTGTVLTLYRNGVSSGSTTNSTNFNNTAQIGLGAAGTAPGSGAIGDFKVAGYLTSVRLVKGTAIYTANFTPTFPLTVTVNTQLLLLVSSEPTKTIDSSRNKFSVINIGGVTYSSTIVPPVTTTTATIPNTSINFNANNQTLTLSAQTLLSFGTGNFTIEMWVYPTALPPDGIAAGLIDARASTATTSWAVSLQLVGGVMYPAISLASTGPSGNIAVPLNTWTHLVWVRNVGTGLLKMFVNGVEAYSATNTDVLDANGITQTIGKNNETGRNFRGYISNLRIVKGIPLYTAGFVVPATILGNTQPALYNISGISGSPQRTSLLIGQRNTTLDYSSFNNIITNNNATISNLAPDFIPTIISQTTSSPGAYVSTPGNQAYIRNKTKYNDPAQVEGYFSSFIPEHTGEEDRVQAWV